jgi:hypothetical protein
MFLPATQPIYLQMNSLSRYIFLDYECEFRNFSSDTHIQLRLFHLLSVVFAVVVNAIVAGAVVVCVVVGAVVVGAVVVGAIVVGARVVGFGSSGLSLSTAARK